MLKAPWIAASRSNPCPICEKGSGINDWCIFIPGQVAICGNVESNKRHKDGRWLHRLDKGQAAFTPIAKPEPKRDMPRPDIQLLARQFATAVNPARLDRLARDLGLSAAALKDIGIGWAGEHWCGKCRRKLPAWSFAMLDVDGQVLGFRLRFIPCGHKSAIRGGKEGLFIPSSVASEAAGTDARTSRLFVCEGPTDTAALLDLGLAAIGRPSCTGGLFIIRDWLRSRHKTGRGITQLVIVADDDKPGLNGARTLASVTRLVCPIVQIITPPAGIKDARAWKHGGAMAADVERAVWAAPHRSLSITTQTETRKLKGIRK